MGVENIQAQEDMVEVGDGQLLELMQWGWETSGCAQKDVVEARDKQLGSRGHDGSRRQVVVLELIQWGWETSGQA